MSHGNPKLVHNPLMPLTDKIRERGDVACSNCEGHGPFNKNQGGKTKDGKTYRRYECKRCEKKHSIDALIQMAYRSLGEQKVHSIAASVNVDTATLPKNPVAQKSESSKRPHDGTSTGFSPIRKRTLSCDSGETSSPQLTTKKTAIQSPPVARFLSSDLPSLGFQEPLTLDGLRQEVESLRIAADDKQRKIDDLEAEMEILKSGSTSNKEPGPREEPESESESPKDLDLQKESPSTSDKVRLSLRQKLESKHNLKVIYVIHCKLKKPNEFRRSLVEKNVDISALRNISKVTDGVIELLVNEATHDNFVSDLSEKGFDVGQDLDPTGSKKENPIWIDMSVEGLESRIKSNFVARARKEMQTGRSKAVRDFYSEWLGGLGWANK